MLTDDDKILCIVATLSVIGLGLAGLAYGFFAGPRAEGAGYWAMGLLTAVVLAGLSAVRKGPRG